MALIIHADRRPKTTLALTKGAGGQDDLDKLQAAVGGYIEAVYLPPNRFVPNGMVMFVNEDGHRLGLPYNSEASAMAGQPILGDVVVGRREDFAPVDTDLDDDDDDDDDEEEPTHCKECERELTPDNVGEDNRYCQRCEAELIRVARLEEQASRDVYGDDDTDPDGSQARWEAHEALMREGGLYDGRDESAPGDDDEEDDDNA